MTRYCSPGIVSCRYVKINRFLGDLLKVLSICDRDLTLPVGTGAAA